MKRKLLAGLLLCLAFACTKQNEPDEPVKNQKKSVLKINVDDFIKKTKPFPAVSGRASSASTARDSSLAGISDIYYCLYANSYTVVSYRHQTSLDSDFGTISDSILPGTYTIALAASAAPVTFGGEHRLLVIPSIDNVPSGPFPDIFYKNQSVTVAGDTTNIEMPTLSRIMARINVNILDLTPTDSVTVYLPAQPAVIDLWAGVGLDDWPGYAIYGSVALSNESLGNYSTLLAVSYDHYLPLVIRYKDRVTQQWKNKTISVDVYRNTQTVVTGKLYDPISGPKSVGTNFSISINKDWSSTPKVINL